MKKILIIIFAIVMLVALPSLLYAPDYIENIVAATAKSKYVGANVCAGCHKDHYDSWLTTIHPYKVRPANENTVVGDFVKDNTFTVKDIKGVPGLTEYTTKMSVKDGKYFVTTIGPDNKEHTYPIKYTIGGIWKQRYMAEFPNGALHILPVQWDVEPRKWVDYHGLAKQKPGDGKYWSDKIRTWQYQCGTCHVTGLKIGYDKQKDTFKTSWVDSGASCESCHGAGSEHVIAPMNNKAATIINPAKIPDARRAAQVCGQCHNRGVSVAETKVAIGPKHYEYPHGEAGYTPGRVLDNYFVERPGNWPDGSPKSHRQQYNDWKKSKHAIAGVNCWDCHVPHSKGSMSKGSLKASTNELCLKCHNVSNEGMHGLHSVNDCRGCHMPRTSRTAVKRGEAEFDIASHRFKFVSPAETIKHGGLLDKQPNSCNGCHYHEKDKPEDMLKVVESIKNKTKEQFGIGKVSLTPAVEKKEEPKK